LAKPCGIATLLHHHHAKEMSAKEIAESAIHIAGGIDIFTNENVISEEL